MTKEEVDKLQQECIDYIINLPIDVEWKQQRSIMYWLFSYKKEYDGDWSDKLVPSWEEEDGRDMHLRIGFMLEDSNYDVDKYDETRTKVIDYNGVYCDIERYSFRSYEWDRKMGFIIQFLEQFKHIVTAIIKV